MELENTELQDDFSLAFEAASIGEEEPKVEEPKVEEPKVDPEIERLREEAVAREQFTEDEMASVTAMAEEFPEVAAAVKAELRVLHAKLENAYNDKLQAAISQLYQQVAPALAEAQTAARSRFETTVFGAHPDARTILPEVDKWVATKPAFMQKAFNTILDSGTADDTVTLLNLFKQEMKPPAAPAKEGGGEPVVDPKKEQKLAAQEGIRGRQTNKTGGIDEDDFESAFNAAATTR